MIRAKFGKWVIVEDVFDTLDPQLEPILQRAVFSLKDQLHIKLGDNTIAYNDQAKLFLVTTLPNFTPELQVKVTLLNFTVTPSGLRDQMVGLVVAKETPELEAKKNELVLSSAAMKKQLEEIEYQILKLFKEVKGDILEEENLISVLSEAKKTSQEVNTKDLQQWEKSSCWVKRVERARWRQSLYIYHVKSWISTRIKCRKTRNCPTNNKSAPMINQFTPTGTPDPTG